MALELDITQAPKWAGRWSERLQAKFNNLMSIKTHIVATAADLPDVRTWRGRQVWCENVGAGAKRLCISDGINWYRTDTGATV